MGKNSHKKKEKKRGKMDVRRIGFLLIFLVFVYLVVSSLIPEKQEEVKIVPEKQVQKSFTCEERCNSNLKCLNACYYTEINKATITKDKSYCEKLPNSIRQGCLDQIILAKASESNNRGLCDQILTQKIKQDCFNLVK